MVDKKPKRIKLRIPKIRHDKNGDRYIIKGGKKYYINSQKSDRDIYNIFINQAKSYRKRRDKKQLKKPLLGTLKTDIEISKWKALLQNINNNNNPIKQQQALQPITTTTPQPPTTTATTTTTTTTKTTKRQPIKSPKDSHTNSEASSRRSSVGSTQSQLQTVYEKKILPLIERKEALERDLHDDDNDENDIEEINNEIKDIEDKINSKVQKITQKYGTDWENKMTDVLPREEEHDEERDEQREDFNEQLRLKLEARRQKARDKLGEKLAQAEAERIAQEARAAQEAKAEESASGDIQNDDNEEKSEKNDDENDDNEPEPEPQGPSQAAPTQQTSSQPPPPPPPPPADVLKVVQSVLNLAQSPSDQVALSISQMPQTSSSSSSSSSSSGDSKKGKKPKKTGDVKPQEFSMADVLTQGKKLKKTKDVKPPEVPMLAAITQGKKLKKVVVDEKAEKADNPKDEKEDTSLSGVIAKAIASKREHLNPNQDDNDEEWNEHVRLEQEENDNKIAKYITDNSNYIIKDPIEPKFKYEESKRKKEDKSPLSYILQDLLTQGRRETFVNSDTKFVIPSIMRGLESDIREKLKIPDYNITTDDQKGINNKIRKMRDIMYPPIEKKGKERVMAPNSYYGKLLQRYAYESRNIITNKNQKLELPAPKEGEYMDNPDDVPEGPDLEGKGKPGSKQSGLLDSEMEDIMGKYKKFIGCFDIDKIHKITPLNDKSFGFAVFIPWKNKKYEGHWTAVYIDPRKDRSVEYYDSFGNDPPRLLQKELKTVIDKMKLPIYLKFKYNKVIDQRSNSDNCGYFVCKWLMDRFNGKSWVDSTGFSKIVQSEKNINKFKKKMIKYGYV